MSNNWSRAVLSNAIEFPLTPLPVIAGRIPGGLRGTLYRNGPGCLERGGVRVGHWFDGDGAILAVNFHDAGATATYRFVQTPGYQQELASDHFLFANYGMAAPGNFWQRLFAPVKNAANTSVLALPDRLLALWEGGKPYALDLHSLETRGEDDLGALQAEWSYSAHYKQDAGTGEIFNFGVTPGAKCLLHLYRSSASGRIVKTATHQLKGIPILHDFVLAGEYLVFFISPVRLNLLSVLLQSKCFSQALNWRPELGTQVMVFERQSLGLVSQSTTDAWYQWHFGNGYVDKDGMVIIDFVQYADFQTNQYLQEVATGTIQTSVKNWLARAVLNPQTGKISKVERVLDYQCEFPQVPPNDVGKSTRYTYLSGFRDEHTKGEILNAIARFDWQTGNLTIADPGANRYPSEPIFVSDNENPDQGWILTVVYDANQHSSEVWIYDCDRLDDEPIAKLELPSFIPHSFHGTWLNKGL